MFIVADIVLPTPRDHLESGILKGCLFWFYGKEPPIFNISIPNLKVKDIIDLELRTCNRVVCVVNYELDFI